MASLKTGIPGYVKGIMAVAVIFMPIILILPFFFWGHAKDPNVNNVNLIEARILPVGQLTIASVQKAAQQSVAAQVSFNPQATYDSVCSACHATGAVGAPKFKDHDAWAARLKEAGSFDALVKAATNGVGAMPPKGGASITDDQFKQMVAFMLDNAKVSH